MKAWWFLVLALLLAAASVTAAYGRDEAPRPAPGRTNAQAVMSWNAFASSLVAANLPPGPQTHALAVAQIAVHAALNAVDPRYEPYAFAGSAPGASPSAAVAAAAHDVLVRLVPQAAASVEAEYDAALPSIPDGAPKAAGIATGKA